MNNSVDLEYGRKELAVAQPVALAPAPSLIQYAIQQGAGIDVIERLMALKEREEANQARIAYNEALAAFKAEAVRIVKNVEIKDGPLKGKRHADLFGIVESVTPALSKHGLSLSWKLTKDEPAWMEVTCTLRHVQGHSESVSMGGAPDTGPGRNAIQARGSAKTYLERYTATAILGMAAADQDNDGAGAAKKGIPEPRYVECRDWLRCAPSLQELKRLFDSAYKEAEEIGDKDTMLQYIKFRDERAAQLRKEGAR